MSLAPEHAISIKKPITIFEDPFAEEVWKTTYKDYNDETVDDTLFRVAKHIASAETPALHTLWTDRFFDMLSNFKCTAGGRIYSNAGTEWDGTVLYNCFASDAKVLTNEGYKLITDVEIGDLVLTHKGRWQPVTNVLQRHYLGKVYRLTSHLFTDDIIVTPEHPFYQGNEQWIAATDVNNVTLAYQEDTQDGCVELDLVDFFEEEIRLGYVTVEPEYLFTQTTFIGNSGAKGLKETVKIKRKIIINDDFAYVLGRYVGDGCSFSQKHFYSCKFPKSGFSIVFNNKEKKEMEYCKNILESAFEISLNVNLAKQQNCVYLRKGSIILGTFFHRFIGDGFNTKQIPAPIWRTNHNVQQRFLHGIFDADGIIRARGDIGIILANEDLINDIHALCIIHNMPMTTRQFSQESEHVTASYSLSVGAHYSYNFRQGMTKHYDDERKSYKVLQPPTNLLQITSDGRLLTNRFVKTEEHYDGYVYNISVKGDESYVVNNVITHNCYVGPRYLPDPDSLVNIMKHLNAQIQTLKSEGGWGENFCLRFDQVIFVMRNGSEFLTIIDEVKKGDCVLSDDGLWHEVEAKMTIFKDNMIELQFDNNEIVHCTDDHCFLVIRSGEHQWVEAKELLDSDEILHV